MDPLRHTPFMVFHDGTRYFEDHFGLTVIGSLSIDPHTAPGARRVSELRSRLEADGAVCVFGEPGANPKTLGLITQGTGVKSATIDPLGALLEPGPDLYFGMMREMARSVRECLSE
jgi:zinc transport system substrate-binding protein